MFTNTCWAKCEEADVNDELRILRSIIPNKVRASA
jgi:hypothetical protein